MYNTVKKHKPDSGFTLIEMAVVMIIVGVLIVPALSIYTMWQKNQKIEHTKLSMDRAEDAVGGFRSIYGRYPCPARANAVPGDQDYGYEALVNPPPAPPQCDQTQLTVVQSQNAGLADRDVLIGVLPFRTMHMQEEDAYDGYGNRLVYAVTKSLTNDVTFNTNNGGISIVDANDDTMINPADSAHFAIITHNENDAGAITRFGVQAGPCPPMPSLENENCDGNDSIFRIAPREDGFDDIISYSTGISMTEWQYSVADIHDIHLRRANNLALGANNATDLTAAEVMEVMETVPDSGVITSSAGVYMSQNLCDETASNCFAPQLIGGQIAQGEGMDCGGAFIVGIANGAPICSDEIFFSCPAGRFMAGINPDGTLICSVKPPPPCAPMPLGTTCGDFRTLPQTISGGYALAYSGQCYKIAPLDTALVAGMTKISDIQAYVDSLNNALRTSVDCGADASTGLVRDTFECKSSIWQTTPVNTLERLGTATFPNYSPLYSGGSTSAETSGVSYNPASPMAADSFNNDEYHDCWCREDYQLIQESCPGGLTGKKITIRKHSCPQTEHTWQTIYSDSSGFCACAPYTDVQNQDCDSYFGVTPGTIVGNVKKTFNNTCDSSGNVITDPNPAIDISDCKCPEKSPNPVITTESCPLGTTNSFTFESNGYTDVHKIFKNTWSCPGGTPPANATSAADAGKWSGKQLVHTENCTCDNNLKKIVTEPCPSGTQGPPIEYEVKWDCTTQSWEPKPLWNLVKNECQACVWKKPSGNPQPSSSPVGSPINTPCTCGTTGLCRESAGNNMYDVWSGCQCAAY